MTKEPSIENLDMIVNAINKDLIRMNHVQRQQGNKSSPYDCKILGGLRYEGVVEGRIRFINRILFI